MRISFASALSATIISCLFAPSSQAAYTFVNVADSTMSDASGPFHGFTAPAIGNGVAAFVTNGASANAAIRTGNGGPLTLIAAQDATLTDIGTPDISNGTAAFSAFASAYIIYTGNGGPLSEVVRSGDPAPSGTIQTQSLPRISGPDVAFEARFTGNNFGVFKKTSTQLLNLAKTGDPAPAGTFDRFSSVTVSNGSVAYLGIYGATNGIFVHDGTSNSSVVQPGDFGPVDRQFAYVADPQISAGAVAFVGGGTVQATREDFQGIYLKKNGVTTTLIERGDAAPVGTFTSFPNFSLSHDAIAFWGNYGANQSGIFLTDGTSIDAVIKTGDPLFGSTVAGVGMWSTGLDKDGSGRIGFSYRLANGRVGVAIAGVPEPSAATLLAITGGCCLTALAAAKRRRCCLGR